MKILAYNDRPLQIAPNGYCQCWVCRGDGFMRDFFRNLIIELCPKCGGSGLVVALPSDYLGLKSCFEIETHNPFTRAFGQDDFSNVNCRPY